MNSDSFILSIKAFEWIYIFSLLILIYKRLKGKGVSLKALDLLIGFIVFFEVFLAYFFVIKFENNRIIFNIYPPIYIISLIYFFTFEVKSEKLKHWVLFFSGAWLISTIYFFVVQDVWNTLDNLSYVFGLSILSTTVVIYFQEIIKYNKQNISNDPLFYLGIGILVFYSTSFTLLVFVNNIVVGTSAKKAFGDILKFGNIFLSLGYLGAALCSKKENLSIK